MGEEVDSARFAVPALMLKIGNNRYDGRFSGSGELGREEGGLERDASAR